MPSPASTAIVPGVPVEPPGGRWSGLSLLEFIPALSPEFSPPYHQADWCVQIEACVAGGVRALNETPIRHFKSETTYHGIAWLLTRDPTLRIILMVADHEVATDRGKRIRQICEAAGVGPERGQNVILSWKNERGGGVQVMSAKQSKLGQDCDVLIFDDPISEHDAFMPEVRTDVDMAIAHYTARAGRPSRRGSVLGVMSRWHPDDPIGRRLLRKAVQWTFIHHAAVTVSEDGTRQAFAPDVMSLEELDKRRAELAEADPTERLWHAQFQNDPLPDSLGLFKQPSRYTELPSGPFRTLIGIDMSYSPSRRADHFALVVMKVFTQPVSEVAIDGTARMIVAEVAYVVAVWRERWDPAMVDRVTHMARAMFPGAKMFSYMAGPEIGIAHYLAERGLAVEVMPARYSKRQRAQKSIDKANAARILFPVSAPWVEPMIARMILFTGADNAGDDDEVDALVSAVDGGMSGRISPPRAFGERRNY